MSALQSALAEIRACADTGSSAALLADECAALTAEIDRLTVALGERDELRARIGRAHTELRSQHLCADHTLHPDISGPLMAALEAVETHLVGPEHRPARDGSGS